ncbi:MAG TPA: MerR family transcriptional regulator [Candidatus Angelobacter sp.]|jgi:DNA-binding transcriptional MerR regulator|nr:MerR family transcriptional regulator [Candidatus Angelobacter sp.]
MNDSKRSGFRSGELASITGVSRDALRYYERQNLLPKAQRLANGYRCYPAEALMRVKVIRAALGIGFTVEDLAEILGQRDRGDAPCGRVHALAVEKARALASRINELKRLRRTLDEAIRKWERQLRATKPGQRAGLLELFVAAHPDSPGAVSPLMSPGLQRKIQARRGKHK